MKRLIATVLCGLLAATGAFAAFPTNTSTKTIALDKLKPDFTDFRFSWRGYDSQSVTFTIETTSGTGLDMTGSLASFQATKQVAGGSNVAFIAISTSDTTIATSNITFTVAYTNIPPDGVYKAELFLQDASTPVVTRSLGRGTIKVEQSLFASDASDFTFPSLTATLADLSDVILTGTAQGDILYRGAAAWNNLAAGTSGQVLTTGAAGANPSWTSKTTDTAFTNKVVAGSLITVTGGTASGSNVISQAADAHDGRYYRESEVDALLIVKAGTNLFSGASSTGLITSVAGDAGKFLKADGSWGTPAGAGDITAVVAGTALFGGGTSGSVTLTHSNLSSQASVNGSGVSFIQDVTMDAVIGGHVTSLTAVDLSGVTWNGANITNSDHGKLNAASLGDDDHTQYLLVSGARAMSGDLDLGNANDIVGTGAYNLEPVGNLGLNPGTGIISVKQTNALGFTIQVDFTKDQAGIFLLDATGNQLILANYGGTLQDYDHAAQTDPTFFVHSDTNPNDDNTQWISFSHDKTDGVVSVGTGKLNFSGKTFTNATMGGGVTWNGTVIDIAYLDTEVMTNNAASGVMSASKTGRIVTMAYDGTQTHNESGATNMSATELRSGTVPAARLSGSSITLPYDTGASIVSTNFSAYRMVRVMGGLPHDVDFTLTHVQCAFGTQVVYFVEGATNTAFTSLATTNVTLTATTTGAQSSGAFTVEAGNQLLMVADGTAGSGGTTNRIDSTLYGTHSWTLP